MIIPLTPPQAQHIAAKMAAFQEAKRDAEQWFAFAVAGHAPDGCAFVSVNVETGELVVQAPQAAKIAASGDI